jgi:hypothetical protein
MDSSLLYRKQFNNGSYYYITKLFLVTFSFVICIYFFKLQLLPFITLFFLQMSFPMNYKILISNKRQNVILNQILQFLILLFIYSCEDNSTKNDSGISFLNVIFPVIVKYLSIS